MIENLARKIEDISDYEIESVLRDLIAIVGVLHAKIRVLDSQTAGLAKYGGIYNA